MSTYKNSDKPLIPPQDFPHFELGEESAFNELARNLLWKHTISHGPSWKECMKDSEIFSDYSELPSGPKCPLWDGWLCESDLWPAMDTDETAQRMRTLWKDALLNRKMDTEGNVETDNGLGYAHPYGWPFPTWESSAGVGWHFTYKGQTGGAETPSGLLYRPRSYAKWDDFSSYGLSAPEKGEYGLYFTATEEEPYFETPAFCLDAHQGPFLEVRWFGSGFSGSPRVAFLREGETEYREEDQMYCAPFPREFTNTSEAYSLFPLYRLSEYRGKIVKFRLYPGKAEPNAKFGIAGLFSCYDSRHNINNPQYLRACCDYFAWTHDLDFLRQNLPKMRKVLRAFRKAHHIAKYGVVNTTWVGHEGRTGVWFDRDGEKHIEMGYSLAGNWLDILPGGWMDTYATVFYYQALVRMAQLEEAVAKHPQWNMPEEFDAEDYGSLNQEADRVRETANRLFWNEKTGRFVIAIDIDHTAWDIGCVLINLEAVASGLATPEHAQSIMDWVSGRRIVAGDTSTGEDIYAFTFAPRITTRKNLEYWFWGWSEPEKIPFGQQVQDGGAALAFSYFDMMSRIQVYGPDDAWQRMQEVLNWFKEVEEEGGYAAYYRNRGISMQGDGVGGGIGITREFFESILPMQTILRGFLGLKAMPDRLVIAPCVPASLGKVSVDRIRWGDATLSITAERGKIVVLAEGKLPAPIVCKEGWEISIEKK